MRLFYTTTLLLFVSTITFAQSLNIHTTYGTFADFSPRWRLGVEYEATPSKFAYSLDIGYGNYALNSFIFRRSQWGTDYQFLEIRPEVKFFFAKDIMSKHRVARPSDVVPHRDISFYGSIELFYLHLKNTFENNHYHTAGTTIGYSSALFHKLKVGGHLKYGVRFAFRRLVIDNSIGIGAAYRNRFLTDVIDPQELDIWDKRGELWTPGYQRIKRSLIPHFTCNLRMGWFIWRKK